MRSYKFVNSPIWLALICFPVICQSDGWSAVAPGATVEKPRILATRFFRVGAETRALTLWEQELQPLSEADFEIYFSKHPEQTSFPPEAWHG